LVGVALIARLCSPALAAAASPQEWPDTFGFAQAQVEAGRSSYAKFCSSCHGDKLDGAGAPALTGEAFLTRWASGTRPARDLYDAVSRMPKLAPESLSKSQYLDITSYILATNGFAPSSTPASETTLQKLLKGSSLPKENSPLVEHGEFPRPPSSVAQASQKSPTTADLAAPSDDDWLMYNRDYTGNPAPTSGTTSWACLSWFEQRRQVRKHSGLNPRLLIDRRRCSLHTVVEFRCALAPSL